MNIEYLIKNGIDYNDGLKRFIDNSTLYEKYLRMFLTANDYGKAKEAVKNKEYDELFEYIHAMKGVTGNLSLSKLYLLTCEFTEKIRFKNYDNIDEAFDDLYKEYERTCQVIKNYFGL